MDLSTLDVSEAASRGATMELRNPATGETLYSDGGEPVSITVLGSDSSEYRKRLRSAANGRINSRKKQTIEQLEQDGIGLLVAVTTGWRNIVVEGQNLEFSPEEARRLYEKYPWIREQVDEFVNERANFLTNA